MTAGEVRGTALAYYRLKGIMKNNPLPPQARASFTEFIRMAELDCGILAEGTAPGRWTCKIVGPVLAAAMGSATYMRGLVHEPVGALRIFGLSGTRALPPPIAWKLMQPYLAAATLPPEAVADLARRSNLRLKLPPFPSPVEALEELTRHRCGSFAAQVGYWLAESFRENSAVKNSYTDLYRRTMAGMADISEEYVNGFHGRMSREDWECMMAGKTPQSVMELRASYVVARQFLTDYWERWQEKKVEAAQIPIDMES